MSRKLFDQPSSTQQQWGELCCQLTQFLDMGRGELHSYQEDLLIPKLQAFQTTS